MFGFGRMGITHLALANAYTHHAIEWDIFEPNRGVEFALRRYGRRLGVGLRRKPRGMYDYAFICSPPQHHAANFREIRESAKKVFVEKPGKIDKADLLDCKSRVYVGYVLRHNSCVRKIADQIGGREVADAQITLRANSRPELPS